MLDCFGLKMMCYKDKGEGKTKHIICPLFCSRRGNSNPFYLLDNQGHCDTVLSKKTFLKAFQFCGLNLFIKIIYNTVLKCEAIRITLCWI